MGWVGSLPESSQGTPVSPIPQVTEQQNPQASNVPKKLLCPEGQDPESLCPHPAQSTFPERRGLSPTPTSSEERSVPQTEVVSIAKTQSSKVEKQKQEVGAEPWGTRREAFVGKLWKYLFRERNKTNKQQQKDGWNELRFALKKKN